MYKTPYKNDWQLYLKYEDKCFCCSKLKEVTLYKGIDGKSRYICYNCWYEVYTEEGKGIKINTMFGGNPFYYNTPDDNNLWHNIIKLIEGD